MYVCRSYSKCTCVDTSYSICTCVDTSYSKCTCEDTSYSICTCVDTSHIFTEHQWRHSGEMKYVACKMTTTLDSWCIQWNAAQIYTGSAIYCWAASIMFLRIHSEYTNYMLIFIFDFAHGTERSNYQYYCRCFEDNRGRVGILIIKLYENCNYCFKTNL
jgi:hypothetical protein